MSSEHLLVNELTEEDVGKWFTYIPGVGRYETGKLKSYNNDRKIAFIVYHCSGFWDTDLWKGYTAAATDYCNLIKGNIDECK